jgi:16S rRNA processing protein RimM
MKALPTAIQIAQSKGLKILSEKEKSKDQWIPLGRVLGAHGIRGELRIHLDNPESNCVNPGARLGLLLFSGDLAIVTVVSRKPRDRISFDGIANRNEAEAFKGASLFVRRQDMPKALDNEVYLIDLLGAVALDTEDNLLGEVIGFADNRAQHLIEIKTQDGEKVLLPFVFPILQEIDESKRRIIFDLPSGFFD